MWSNCSCYIVSIGSIEGTVLPSVENMNISAVIQDFWNTCQYLWKQRRMQNYFNMRYKDIMQFLSLFVNWITAITLI